MTSQYRHRRSSNPNTVVAALEPGEIHVNTANRQLTVGDADGASIGAPIPLLGVRYFDARAVYAVNDYVVYVGNLYRAKVAITTPAAFTPIQWDLIAGQQQGPFVAKSGDTMTGHLGLPGNPAGSQAVRRNYVDATVAGLATTGYVDFRDSLALPKTGGAMTGALVLAGPPTTDLMAASKAYVDVKTVQAPGVPTGMIMDFAGTTPPTGWLVCDGQTLNIADYPALFAAIGGTWGWNGSTTFNLPSLISRYRRHRDDNSSLAGSVGNYQSPVMQSHYHYVNLNSGYVSSDHSHYTSGNTGAADRVLNHSHGGVATGQQTWSGSALPTGGAPGYIGGFSGGTAVAAAPDHLHSFGLWSGGISANHYHTTSGNAGGGSADGNETRPYSATVLACIKT